MTVDRPSWAPAEVDLTRPSVARVYDYYLGGSHNFESDRTFAQSVLEVFPDLPVVARDNRHFLRRVVQYLCGQGVDQFLDLGSGIPTVGNVHEVARSLSPTSRVVYVDHDPVAVAHSRAILQGDDRAVAISGDLREPAKVLADATAVGGLDLGRPIAVLLVSVLHFVVDDDRPADIVAGYMAATAPGSHLVLSHARKDGQRDAADVEEIYNRSPNPMRMRTLAEVEALFGDLTMLEPGVVPIPRWRPEPTTSSEPDVGDDYAGLAGVGRRD